jgi:hypothetical protein
MKRIYLFLIIIAVASCSPQWHIKRAIAKDPSILTANNTVKIDTTIITRERTLHDTIVLNDVDSITITKDRVVTKIWRQYDTLRVETICPPDTLRIEVTKDCPPQVIYTPKQSIWKSLFWVLIVVIILAVVFVLKKLKSYI